MLTTNHDNTLPFQGMEGPAPSIPPWIGMRVIEGVWIRLSGATLLILFLMFAACMTSTIVHAGSPDAKAVKKAYTKAEKTCKQIERGHEKMIGEHKLMFKAWQEKSSPLLTEDEEVFTECKTTLSAFKDITEQLDKTADDTLKEKLFNDYEKIQSVLKDIAGRHETLREKHGMLFHEMMGH